MIGHAKISDLMRRLLRDESATFVPVEAHPAEQALHRQAEVLHHLLAYHPGRLTLRELDAAVSNGDGTNPPDDTEVAVSELVRNGLVHRDGQFVIPSRAAVYSHQLPPLW